MSGGDIGTVIGGAVGFMVGGVGGISMGMSIGGLAGGLLMPDEVGIQDGAGPRLDNLKILTSTYGVPITEVYGAFRVGGNVIWSTDIIETVHEREEEVGKGGSETYTVTTYSYDISFAVALCTGPVTGVKRIWADGTLIYDGNSNTAFYASSEYTSGPMDIFLGGTDQKVDWSMQSYNADTPAYRNICYIRFNNLQLEKFGNRMPNITAEVVSNGINEVAAFVEDQNLDDQLAAPDAYRSINISLPYNFLYDYDAVAPIQGLYMLSFDGYKTYLGTHYGGSGHYSGYANTFIKYTNSSKVHHINNENVTFEEGRVTDGVKTPYRNITPFPHHKNQDGGYFSYGSHFWGRSYMAFHKDPSSIIEFHRLINIWGVTGDHGYTLPLNEYRSSAVGNERRYYDETFFCLELSTDTGLGCVLKGKGQKSYPEIGPEFTEFYKWDNGSYIVYGAPEEGALHAIIGVSSFPTGGDGPIGMDVNYDKIFLLTSTSSTGVHPNLVYIRVYDLDGVPLYNKEISSDIQLGDLNATIHTVRIFVGDSYVHILVNDESIPASQGHRYAKYTLDLQLMLFRPFESPSIAETGLDRLPMQYNSGIIKSFFRYGTSSTGYNVTEQTINLNYISSSVTLKTITDDLCSRSGLNIEDYDNTEGGLIPVSGFSIPNTSSARASIATLQSVFLFDLVEEDFKIKIKVRDGIISHTLSEDNIVDNDIEIAKKLDIELPKKITLEYSNSSLDYLTGAQSIMRIDGNSDNNAKVTMPIAITDTEAKQLVEKLMYAAWTGALTLTFSIPFDDNVLVSDVIKIEYKGIIYVARIIKIVQNANKKMSLDCVSDGTSMYISDAVGSDTSAGFTAPIINTPILSKAIIFNGPTLSNDVINSFGIYYTAFGYSDSWPGSEMFKSVDSGNTYSSIGSCMPNQYKAIGVVTLALGSAKSTVWDTANTINVKLNYGELFDASLSSVLSGSNYIKVGNEILQYANATLESDGTYTLDTLLRGRRGTEWAIDGHEVMEVFIFLTSEIQFSFSTMNVERYYKSVSFNTFLESSNPVLATYDGTNLKPFSPASLGVIGNVISWLRRDRYISGYFNVLPNSESQEKYKIELFESDVSQFIDYVSGDTVYVYDDTTYPNIDKIQVSQYSDNLLEYGYIAEITI